MEVRAFAIDIDGTLTENGSKVHLQSLSLLRALERSGYRVLFVTGRSSIEAYILAMFLGTTRVAIGENGGVITTSPTEHLLLADKGYSERAYELLKSRVADVRLKPVFPRMTEVVLERTFSIDEAMGILKSIGLHEKARSKVNRLSGGERQRVAIARALMQGAEVVLADEPVSNLDRDNAHSILDIFRRMSKNNSRSSLIVMHDKALAEEYADEAYLLADGRLARLW
ncbi:MAG: ATP-binding cassette domain-containing protein [Candidatus Nitrosocaldus sp.]